MCRLGAIDNLAEAGAALDVIGQRRSPDVTAAALRGFDEAALAEVGEGGADGVARHEIFPNKGVFTRQLVAGVEDP